MKSTALPCAIAFAAALLGTAQAAAGDPAYRIVWDDFRSGWSADAPDARWLTFSDGSYVANDGVPTVSPRGLMVVPRGVNSLTGEPAFSLTLGQDAGALAPFDHAKWIVVMNHVSSAGFLGFDAVPGKELTCEAEVSAQAFGGWGEPFGDAVLDPEGDLRLASAAISAFDPETFVIFNFLVTNTALYAWYERPVFLRSSLGNYASFAFAVPVMSRRPDEEHRLGIAYDRAAGTVRWLVDGKEAYRVETIGARIDRKYLLIDHGGDDVSISPAQLDCGMALFDFLDGYGPTRRGLVQIDPSDDYFDPRVGAPVGMTFVDPDSTRESRLFGQGAAMQVRRYVVESRPSGSAAPACY